MTDSLSAAASQCLSHHVPQWQDGGTRAFLATSTKLPGLKARRTMVKPMMVREPEGAEDATEVQKMTSLVSDGFVRG